MWMALVPIFAVAACGSSTTVGRPVSTASRKVAPGTSIAPSGGMPATRGPFDYQGAAHGLQNILAASGALSSPHGEADVSDSCPLGDMMKLVTAAGLPSDSVQPRKNEVRHLTLSCAVTLSDGRAFRVGANSNVIKLLAHWTAGGATFVRNVNLPGTPGVAAIYTGVDQASDPPDYCFADWTIGPGAMAVYTEIDDASPPTESDCIATLQGVLKPIVSNLAARA